jgi:hypothetical protein
MRDRTADLLRARQALSQLSYNPFTYSENIHQPSKKAFTKSFLTKAVSGDV